MKIIKYFLSIMVLFALATGCTQEKFDDLSFVDKIVTPSNLSILHEIDPDNSGKVTITPLGEGCSTFDIYFGDGTEEPATIFAGASTEHIYTDGQYTVKVVAHSTGGKVTEESFPLTLSFKTPENFEISVENDAVVSKKVNISAKADYAIEMSVLFKDLTDFIVVFALPGETVSHTYANPGDYEITVIAKSGSIVTLDSTFTFTVTEILGPVEAAPTPPERDTVISVFSEAYTDIAGTEFNPNWGQSTVVSTITVGGNNTIKYGNLNYQGTAFANPIDASSMGYLHLDMWTLDATAVNIFPISPGNEKAYALPITAGKWVSYDIPLSKFSDVVDLADIIQFKFDGTGGSTIYLDNIYFH